MAEEVCISLKMDLNEKLRKSSIARLETHINQFEVRRISSWKFQTKKGFQLRCENMNGSSSCVGTHHHIRKDPAEKARRLPVMALLIFHT